jgi:DUF177 domain-containing protein
MSNTPLPKQVDVRKFVAADVTIEAREPLANFARLPAMLEASAGDVEVQLHFYVDEQRIKRVDGAVRTTLMVLCQRCLKPLPLAIDSRFSVAVVWSDEEAGRLPKELEPYIVGEEPQDVRELVEDELILSVPYVSYHDEGQCVAEGYDKAAELIDPEPELVVEAKENPFNVLAQLKDPSKKSR